MPLTYPCPGGPADLSDKCLTKATVQAVEALISAAAQRVQAFQSLMGAAVIAGYQPYAGQSCANPPETNAGSCMCTKYWRHIIDYVDALFATGYVVKQVKKPDGGLWNLPPENQTKVGKLRACGAFWGSRAEIEACMRTSCSTGKSISKNEWNGLWKVLSCMAYFGCTANCACIICEDDPSDCRPCDQCLTVLVGYDGLWALATAALAATAGCVNVYQVTEAWFVDSQGYGVLDMYMNATISVVKTYAIWNVSITTAEGVYSHRPEMVEFGEQGPSKLCEDVPLDGQIISTTVNVYEYENGVTTPQAAAQVYMAFNSAICEVPWNGVRHEYVVGGAINCAHCVENTTSPPLSNVSHMGAGLSSGSASYFGMDIFITVDFDSELCAYRMQVSCRYTKDSGDVVIWEGVKLGCGGPEGNYNLIDFNAKYSRDPCYTSSMSLT